MISMRYAIETVNISKKFTRKRKLGQIFRHPLQFETVTALNKVTLQVSEGEVFGILGPNGAGKTTLIKLLCTLILPDEGEAWIEGYSLLEEDRVKRYIGLVTGEERSFYWRLSGRKNLEFFAALQDMTPAAARKSISSVMELVGLKERGEDHFQTYSAGMKQRLALARGLLHHPRILLDEPTKSLDPVAAGEIRTFIRQRLVKEEGKTVFLATHNLEEAETLCDRIAIIDRGKILVCGTPEEVRRRVKREDRYILKVRDLSLETLDKIRRHEDVIDLHFDRDLRDPSVWHLDIGLLSGEATLSFVIESLIGSGGTIIECNHLEASLEEAFSHLVKENSSKPPSPRAPRGKRVQS